MHQKPATHKSEVPSDITPYIYGTSRSGDSSIPLDDQVKIARLVNQYLRNLIE